MLADARGSSGAFGIVVPGGDPGALDHAASTCRSIAGTLARVGGELAAACVVPGWNGVAQINYSAGVRADAHAPSAAQEAFGLAGRVLHELAHELRAAQRATRAAVARAQAADTAARAAARRQADAQQAAQSARTRADAAAATIQHAAALGHPAPGAHADHAQAVQDAAQADADAAAASRAYDRATGELSDAQRVGQAAHDRYEHEARRAAKVLGGLAQVPQIMRGPAGTPFGFTGGPGAPPGVLPLLLRSAPPSGAGAGDGHDLGHDLLNILGFLWNGNGDKHLPLRKIGTAFGAAWGVPKYLQALGTYGSWLSAGVATSDGASQLSLADLALFNAQSKALTWNNGLAARGLAWAGGKVPALEGAASWLGDASRATPVFTKLAPVLAIPGVAAGGYTLYKDGNPIDAIKRNPDQYATHVTGMAFSTMTAAFVIAPNPYTGGAVIVTGVAYGGAELWEHRQEVWNVTKAGADLAWKTSPAGLVWDHRQMIGDALDSGYHVASSAASTGFHAVTSAPSAGAHLAEDGAKSIWHALGG